MNLRDILPSFKRHALLEKGLRSTTYKSIARTVQWLAHDTGDLQVNSFDTQIIRNFLLTRRERRLWSIKTFINYRQNLKSFFDFCVREGHIKHNPVDPIAKPKLPERLPRCLNDNQIKRLLSALVYHQWSSKLQYIRNEAIIRTFLMTGLRLSELLNLQVSEVNLLEGVIYVHQGKGRKDRLVPIHPKLIPYFKRWLSERKKSLPVSLYFFTSIRSGKRLTMKNLYAIFKALQKTCEFRFTPHMLRHTFARISLESNLNLFHLKEIMGHNKITTTQIYMSVSIKSTKEDFQKLTFI